MVIVIFQPHGMKINGMSVAELSRSMQGIGLLPLPLLLLLILQDRLLLNTREGGCYKLQFQSNNHIAERHKLFFSVLVVYACCREGRVESEMALHCQESYIGSHELK